MAFSAGVLCCAQNACVYLDVNAESDAASWDLIPHVTEISFTQTANTSKLVTSSTAGLETSVCGTVSQTGVLAIACHDGDGPDLCINSIYHIMWSVDCDNIGESPVDPYYQALIRITSKPVLMQISGNAATIVTYAFDIVEWVHQPTCDTAESTT
jgi:hypothetical protein